MTEDGKDRAAVIAPPPLLTVVCIAAGWIAGHFRPFPFVPGPERLRDVLCVAFLLLAAGFLVAGVGQLMKHKEDPSPYKPTKAIVGSGVYRFTRNPIYIGFLTVVLAVSVCADNAWLLLSFVALFVLLHFGVVKREERYLSAKFGEGYDEYRRRVRRWL